MAYSNFHTLNSVLNQFNLKQDSKLLFTEVIKEPSDWLKTTLDQYKTIPFTSEKARNELIVMPILSELKFTYQQIMIHSGNRLDIEPEQSLNGECDFILSLQEYSPEITAPIFGLVEAKDADINKGFGQCLAQMIGAKIFNEKDNKFFPAIYGCVTTGEIWQFMKLENNKVWIDEKRYYIDRVELILGVLEAIVREFI